MPDLPQPGDKRQSSHAPSRSNTVDVELLVDGRTSHAALEEIAEKTPTEVADSVLPELRMHHLLSASLSPAGRFEDRIFHKINREITDLQTRDTTATQAFSQHSTWKKKRTWLVIFILTGLLATTVAWLSYQRPLVQEYHDGHWQSLSSSRLFMSAAPAVIASSATQRQLRLADGAQLILAANSSVLIDNLAQPTVTLQSGSLQLTTASDREPLSVVSPHAALSGHGQWTLDSGRHQDRLRIHTGSARSRAIAANVADLPANHSATITATDGMVVDFGQGAAPQPRQAVTAAAFPLVIEHQSVLSENILGALFPQQLGAAIGIAPGTPLRVPFMAPTGYDIRVVLRRRGGGDSLAFSLPLMTGSSLVAVVDGWHGSRHGFHLIGSEHDRLNGSSIWTTPILGQEEAVTIEIRVRDNQAAMYHNGHLLSLLTTETHIVPRTDIQWPDPKETDLLIQPRNDSFDILSLQFRINSDEGSMYGPQLPDKIAE